MSESLVVLVDRLGWGLEDVDHLDLHSSCADQSVHSGRPGKPSKRIGGDLPSDPSLPDPCNDGRWFRGRYFPEGDGRGPKPGVTWKQVIDEYRRPVDLGQIFNRKR